MPAHGVVVRCYGTLESIDPVWNDRPSGCDAGLCTARPGGASIADPVAALELVAVVLDGRLVARRRRG